MMRQTSAIRLVMTAVTLVFVAMTGAASAQAQRDHDWVAPPDAASRRNPLADQPGAEGGGRKVFERRCAACHGDDGRGTTKGPDLTQPGVQTQSDGALFWKISGGNTRHGMPAFSYLPEAQRWQLVLQLRYHRRLVTSIVLRQGGRHHRSSVG